MKPLFRGKIFLIALIVGILGIRVFTGWTLLGRAIPKEPSVQNSYEKPPSRTSRKTSQRSVPPMNP
ncbi:MAG: hypothetical protein LBD29_06490 [Treponema sp.]|nr:hypothetical protein [Treponema sp.]